MLFFFLSHSDCFRQRKCRMKFKYKKQDSVYNFVITLGTQTLQLVSSNWECLTLRILILFLYFYLRLVDKKNHLLNLIDKTSYRADELGNFFSNKVNEKEATENSINSING